MDQPPTEAPGEPPWHALTAAQALEGVESRPEGLTSGEAEARLARFGSNRLPEPERRGPLARLFDQLKSLLVQVLLAAAAASLLLGHALDAAVILGVVVANAVIGFVQEGRAEQALEAIRRLVDPKATVLRDGRRLTVPAETLVPGDIVLLEAGDSVPADLRLLETRGLRIDEAALTGESAPVDKATDPVEPAAALGDRSSMAHAGCLVVAGRGRGVVVATGASSELGRIGELLRRVEPIETPLLRQIAAFARRATTLILLASAGAFLIAWLGRGWPLDQAFMTLVGLAVAAIPEGLPAIVTITLAIGVRRMAARRAIVRRLPAVETLGSVSVIGSDKTGTFTRNEMVVHAIVTAAANLEATGEGYAPEGALLADGRPVDPASLPALSELLEAAALCNESELRREAEGWTVVGDPMEGALLALAQKAGLDRSRLARRMPRLDSLPFDARTRLAATLHALPEGGRVAFLKGAPEAILELCAAERGPDGDRPLERARWEAEIAALAERGERVLALALAPLPPGTDRLDAGALEGRAVLLGLVGLVDPPRAEAEEAVRACREAGIRVLMITGDHALTARAIAQKIGLGQDPVVVTGAELDALDGPALARLARTASVFARTTPEHKLRLVEALQAEGAIVAMTGDGVNDAPALKRADIGIAMGLKGTEAAKEAAQMVLADDNFASIRAAVEEGRTVYDNLVKALLFILPTNGGECLILLMAMLAGTVLPITPLQILWINTATTVALDLVLAFEPTEPGTMRRPPRPPDQPLISAALAWRTLLVSLLFVLGAYGVLFWAEAQGRTLEEARTLVVDTIVAMEAAYLWNVRRLHGPDRPRPPTRALVLGVAAALLLQLAFTYLPAARLLFDTRPIGLLDWLVVLATAALLPLLVGLEGWIRRRIGAR